MGCDAEKRFTLHNERAELLRMDQPVNLNEDEDEPNSNLMIEHVISIKMKILSENTQFIEFY